MDQESEIPCQEQEGLHTIRYTLLIQIRANTEHIRVLWNSMDPDLRRNYGTTLAENTMPEIPSQNVAN